MQSRQVASKAVGGSPRKARAPAKSHAVQIPLPHTRVTPNTQRSVISRTKPHALRNLNRDRQEEDHPHPALQSAVTSVAMAGPGCFG
jgi:hypothetical protein